MMKAAVVGALALLSATTTTLAQPIYPQVFCDDSLLGTIVATNGNETRDSQVYEFEFVEGGSFVASTCSNNTNFDTRIRLYGNEDLTFLMTENNDADEGCEPISVASTVLGLGKPGSHLYIQVLGFDASSAGNYELTVQCNVPGTETNTATTDFTETQTTDFSTTFPTGQPTDAPSGECSTEVELAEWRMAAKIAEILAEADANIARIRANVQVQINALIQP